ncbi:MAG: CRISPR-associated RAMP protein Csx7 [Candidatus Nezhaarchaeales archaeon]
MNKWDWLSHSIMLRETMIDGYIVNVEPLRVGAGREPPLGALADLVALRVKYGGVDLPYIPGSSLKGVFRSYATLLARHSGLKACTGLPKETCGDLEEVEGKKKLNDYINYLMENGKSEDALKTFYERACLMCKIFGSTRYMSKVSFSDAYPVDESGNVIDVKTGIRTGIAIDRRTGAAQPGAFYRVEFVEPGARFKFNIHCRNLPNYALGLLSLVLRRMNKGLVKVGGFKSRGFGAVKVEGLKFRSRDFVKGQSLVMAPLEPESDFEVDLSEFAELEDGWMVAKGDGAWKVLDKLVEVWDRFVRSTKKS